MVPKSTEVSLDRDFIIDRRKNPKDKNIGNRQRFFDRSRKYLRDKVNKKIVDRSIKDKSGDVVDVEDIDDIHEPSFNYDFNEGQWDYVLPGNRDYVPGDKIKKPTGGEGKGSGGSPNGNSEDDFKFSISGDEYLNIVFEDLELPDMVKKSEKRLVVWRTRRAGYATSGSMCNLNLEQSMLRSIGRRIALAFPKDKLIEELEDEIEAEDNEDERRILEEKLKYLKQKRRAIAFLDPIDLRFNNFTRDPVPVSQAVMFALMDVSGSMGEKEKEISKRFFFLLYLFLTRKYRHVDVVFIRHHSEAKECDEEEFFSSQESGGTVISSCLLLMHKIILERYPIDNWNIYAAQATDGDNYTSDNEKLKEVLTKQILPICQHYAYVEVVARKPEQTDLIDPFGQPMYHDSAVLWNMMMEVSKKFNNLVCRKISEPDKVVGVFRDIFKQRHAEKTIV